MELGVDSVVFYTVSLSLLYAKVDLNTYIYIFWFLFLDADGGSEPQLEEEVGYAIVFEFWKVTFTGVCVVLWSLFSLKCDGFDSFESA